MEFLRPKAIELETVRGFGMSAAIATCPGERESNDIVALARIGNASVGILVDGAGKGIFVNKAARCTAEKCMALLTKQLEVPRPNTVNLNQAQINNEYQFIIRQSIRSVSESLRESNSAPTTVAICILENDVAHVGYVGDTRVSYLNGKMRTLSIDDTIRLDPYWDIIRNSPLNAREREQFGSSEGLCFHKQTQMQERIDAARFENGSRALSPIENVFWAKRNQPGQLMGDTRVQPNTFSCPIKPGDNIIMMTDTVHQYCTSEEINGHLAAHSDNKLVTESALRGHNDASVVRITNERTQTQ